MKTRIDVRGVIVPSDYDASWFQTYIERGILTPESRFRRQLAEAKDGAEIYINSPGGSVFAGAEMINAVKAAKREGREVEIVIGAMAASMAAAMVVQSGVPVKAHKNTKLMFHGAWGVTIGGASMHEDEAKLLHDMNSDLKSALTAKGADPEKVEEWFAEGREGWLTAQEAMEIGLVDSILDADDLTKPAVLRMDDVADLERYDLKIAACAGIEIEGADVRINAPPGGDSSPEPAHPSAAAPQLSEPEGTDTTDKTAKEPLAAADPASPDTAPDGASPAPSASSEPASEPAPAAPLPEAAALYDAIEALKAQLAQAQADYAAALKKLQSAKDKEISELRDALHEAAEAARIAEEQHQSILTERDAREAAASAALEKAAADARELNTRLMRLTGAAITPSPELAPANWTEALALAGGDHTKAVAMFPDLHKRVLAAANKNPKKG